MIHFSVKQHSSRHCKVVEITNDNGDLLGTLYPNDDHTGVRFISKYLDAGPHGNIHIDPRFPTVVEFKLP